MFSHPLHKPGDFLKIGSNIQSSCAIVYIESFSSQWHKKYLEKIVNQISVKTSMPMVKISN